MEIIHIIFESICILESSSYDESFSEDRVSKESTADEKLELEAPWLEYRRVNKTSNRKSNNKTAMTSYSRSFTFELAN